MQQIVLKQVFMLPNLLTLMRIALLPVVVFLFRAGQMTTALGVYLAAMLTDVLDGAIARKTNQITALGKLLDPAADKLSLMTLLFLFFGAGKVSGWLVGIVLLKEFAMVVGSGLALQRGIVVQALPVGKAATGLFIVFFVFLFLEWNAAAQVFLYAALLCSLAALIWYLHEVLGRIFQENAMVDHAIS